MQFKFCQSLHLVQPRCLVITLLLITASLCLNAQTLHGRVYIAGTETGIANASVYYNASMVGTATNNSGDFTLTQKADHIPLIVSCVGYATATINDYDEKTLLKVYLTPKTQMLHDVVIGGSDGMSRKEKERIFLNEFLGTSTFAKGCTITNLKDVVLTYHQKTKTLTAACDTPLQIDNKPLGYHISYFLQEFTRNDLSTYFSGNYFYKDAFPSFRKNEVDKNRETAYKGSRLQLIRALWSGKFKEKGFDILILAAKNVQDTNVIRIVSGSKFIDLGNRKLRIFYDQSESALSQNSPALITSTGYYGKGLAWSGDMSAKRIGDNLPFEYWPDEDLDEKSPKTDNASLSAKTALTWPVDAQSFTQVSGLLSPPSVSANDKTNPLLFEKTYLHTDRDVYAQGDTLWFKAYLVNAQDNKPVSSSGTLYVELLAPDSAKTIDREIIRLDNGLGNGDFTLADTLKAGSYRLRAYTNWMRNFGDNLVFEKQITILDTKAIPVAPDPKAMVKSKKVTKSKTVAATAPPTTATINKSCVVRFYPEGGSLVQGISSMVAVKAEDGYGKGVPASGAVLSSVGDTVSRFTCDSLGMGLFALLPIKGLSYHAVVDLLNRVPSPLISGPHDIFNLPSALNTGLTLQIRQTDPLIHVVISNSEGSDGEIIAVANRPAVITMAIKHSGKTVLNRQLNLQGPQTTFKLETASLPEGISAITLYDSQGKPECERLVYVHRPNNKSILSVTTNKKTYQPKEQVTVNIQTQPNSSLSMAVVDASIVPEQADNIVSYLQLQSEVKGNIENAKRYFDTTNVNRFKQLDLLLMTQGWRDFVWRRLADTAIRISYAAEEGIPVSGKVRDENRNKWLSGLNITLFANGAKGDKIFTATSDSLGRFHFDNLMLYGKQNIKLSAANSKGKIGGALWVDTLQPLPLQQHSIKIAGQGTADSSIAIEAKKRIADAEKKTGKITQLKEVTIKDKSKYKVTVLSDGSTYSLWGTSLNQSLTITPKDYELKNLQWYALYHLNGAKPNLYAPGILFPGERGAQYPPILIINGVEKDRFDMTDYYSLPIDRFKKIELKRVAYTRAPKKGPVTTIITYLLFLSLREDFNIDNPGSINTEIEGYYQARTFYTPPPDAKPSLADYRATIHWEPNIKTDATGKASVSFYNAVPQTDVHVIVQGITNNGAPVATSTIYEVN